MSTKWPFIVLFFLIAVALVLIWAYIVFWVYAIATIYLLLHPPIVVMTALKILVWGGLFGTGCKVISVLVKDN